MNDLGLSSLHSILFCFGCRFGVGLDWRSWQVFASRINKRYPDYFVEFINHITNSPFLNGNYLVRVADAPLALRGRLPWRPSRRSSIFG
jgi:hypothetical protein